MKIYNSIGETVGRTPLLRLNNIEKKCDLGGILLAKLEAFNPTGSVKDRAALEMINDAERSGRLSKGGTIIEPTSGNTGIGLAAIGVSRGYKVIIVMPDNMSEERKILMRAYGADLVLTDGSLGMSGAIRKAEELERAIDGAIIAGQFSNPANAAAHKKTTAPEIWEDTGGEVDLFVAGVGTGGTLTGVGEYLKEKNPEIKVIAVEPYDSPVLSKGRGGAHGIQGIGAGFVPDVLNTSVYDEIIKVTTAEAYTAAREIAAVEGVLVGISSGAALFAAKLVAARPENKGKNVVVLLPDTGDRYLSTDLFK
jgi:cysteine synthase A